jgi:hypothetical protein
MSTVDKYRFKIQTLVLIFTAVSLFGCVATPRFIPGAQVPRSEALKICESINLQRINTEITGLDDKPLSFRYAVVSSGNDALRIDILPDQGAYTLAIITVLGESALVVDPEKRTVIEGCSTDRALERFMGFKGISPQVVRGILTGRVPNLNCQNLESFYSVNAEGKEQRVVFLEGNEGTAWEIDLELGTVVKVRLLDSGGRYVRGIAERRENANGKGVTFNLFDPAKLKIEMAIKRLVLNPKLDESVFKVVIPEGWTREEC